MEQLKNIDISKFQRDLLQWYRKNKRDLPWRQTKDPYKIWVSEIMLQQTRVDTVIPYYKYFMEKFPTIHDLANADSQTILKAWEGLGYYSRARNLHHAVREVVSTYNGKVPSDPKKLESLKGIGPYTKGAILSIAFDQPEPAVDGNVMRVFSRILKIEENISEYRVRKKFQEYARKLISTNDPSSFNQGVMELGALICTPKDPMCMLCPVQEHCLAHAEGIEEQLPIKSKAKKQQSIPYVVLILKDSQGEYAIEQRPKEGLLANLWQFPMIPIGEIGMDHIESWFHGEYGVKISVKKKKGHLRHVFTHLIWELSIYSAEILAQDHDNRLQFVPKNSLEKYPFPVSHLNIMKLLNE